MNRFTIRSSSEWKLMTASRPPGRSIEKAEGNAASSEPSSSFTAMRRAWKTRFAGCPSPNRAGAGIVLSVIEDCTGDDLSKLVSVAGLGRVACPCQDGIKEWCLTRKQF